MKKKLNILVLSPHADDAEIAMGGTIAKYVDEGHNVTIMTAILPKENKEGKIDDFMSKNRAKEQENSAKILGAKLDVLDLDPYEFSFSRKYIKIFEIEYPILILSSIVGMMVMISSNDLIMFYIGLELQSLALYVLAAFNRDNLLSSESGVKYFILSALSSGLLLYGCSLIYGFSGSTNFNEISYSLSGDQYIITFGIINL